MQKSKKYEISCNGCHAKIVYSQHDLDVLGLDGIIHKNKWMILAPDGYAKRQVFCNICGNTRYKNK